MKFIHRFAYYIFGILIGSIFVYFFFGNRDLSFDYLPNARVLKNIRTDVRLYSSEAEQQMTSIGIDTADVSAILKHGDVDFKKSSPREKPCKTFYIDGKPKDKNITLIIKKCDTISTIHEIILN